MPKLISFILLFLMSLAFTAEVVVTHKGIATVAFAKEEEKEKETEGKKAKEDKLRSFLAFWTLDTPASLHNTTPSLESAQLSAGYHPKPFNPPDVI